MTAVSGIKSTYVSLSSPDHPCVWSLDAVNDTFWKVVTKRPMCMCSECFDVERALWRSTKCTPTDVEETELRAAFREYKAMKKWGTASSSFELYVQHKHLPLYRSIGRDASIFARMDGTLTEHTRAATQARDVRAGWDGYLNKWLTTYRHRTTDGDEST